MQFQEGSLHFMLFGNSQHLEIPKFQRPYSWDKDLWRTLWLDILQQYAIYQEISEHNIDDEGARMQELDTQAKHYLGAIVTDSGTATIPPKSRVLDGQQRLLTCSILYLALRDATLMTLGRDVAQKDILDSTKRAFDIGFFNETHDESSRLRIRPQDVDAAAWKHLLDPNRIPKIVKISESSLKEGDSTRLIDAYNFFLREIRRTESPTGAFDFQIAEKLFPIDLGNLQQVVLTRLWLVKIMCTNSDDVNAIFESLNAKSKPLQQVDLIKNYLYLSLRTKAETVYTDHWVPMESQVGHDGLERFVWAQMVSTGNNVTQKRTYESVRRTLPPIKADAIESWVKELKQQAALYRRIIEPTKEPNKLLQAVLLDLRAANAQTAEPLILYCLRRAQDEEIPQSDLIATLRLIESLLVRRMIAGIKTQMLNPMFGSLCLKINQPKSSDNPFGYGDSLYSDIALLLNAPEAEWPGDEKLLSGIQISDFYRAQNTEQRMHVLTNLDRIANNSGVEVAYSVSDKTLEHIVPQSFPDSWASQFTPEEQEKIQERMDSLSNLTLLQLPENSTAGNGTWSEKRDLYIDSDYALTKAAAKFEVEGAWTLESLDARAKSLLTMINARWPKIQMDLGLQQRSLIDAEIEDILEDFDYDSE